MQDLRDKLIERAGLNDTPADDVKALVSAACQLDSNIMTRQQHDAYMQQQEVPVTMENRLQSIERGLADLGEAIDRKVDKKGKKK